MALALRFTFLSRRQPGSEELRLLDGAVPHPLQSRELVAAAARLRRVHAAAAAAASTRAAELLERAEQRADARAAGCSSGGRRRVSEGQRQAVQGVGVGDAPATSLPSERGEQHCVLAVTLTMLSLSKIYA